MESLRHRGPDASGRYFRRQGELNVHLFQTRLSILDLDHRANQPMRHDNLVGVFNGEIYNYIEIRVKLLGLGHEFVTTSDTEVLLKAWAQWGPAAQDRFEGMWAFALFDESKGVLYLSRDRFREKPLFVLNDSRGVYFASEPSAIFQMLGEQLPINRQHLERYLVQGHRALYKSSDTYFERLEEVPNGAYLEIRHNGSIVSNRKRYWNVPQFAPEDTTFDAVVKKVRELVIRSVELRLRADVPIAFCMSGGVDSNSLICVAKRALGYDVHGFTVVNDDARYDESHLVDLCVREVGLRHTPVPVSADGFRERMAAMVNAHAGPVATISYYAHAMLMSAISEAGYRISVSGTGADEIFTGYFDHHLMYLAQFSGCAKWDKYVDDWRNSTGKFVRNPKLQDPLFFTRQPENRDHLTLGEAEFAKVVYGARNTPFEEHTYVANSLLRNRMMNELFHEVVPVILREDDLNAMMFSIENRSPFLDRPLLEFMMTVPSELMVQEGFMKAALRHAMAEFVPEEVGFSRRKVGFNAPIESFLRLDEQATRDWLLEESPIFDIVDRNALSGSFAQGEVPNSLSKFLFRFVNAKLFVEQFGQEAQFDG